MAPSTSKLVGREKRGREQEEEDMESEQKMTREERPGLSSAAGDQDMASNGQEEQMSGVESQGKLIEMNDSRIRI